VEAKGIIIAPPSTKDSFMDKLNLLFEMFVKEYGFDLQYTTEPDIPADTDIVLAYGTFSERLFDLNKSIKLVSMVGDIHSYSKEMEGKKQMFWDRADSIWTFLDEEFRRKYPQFVHKFLWVPMYFASYDRYAKIPISERPKIKCLLSGCTHLPYYPIRDHIEKYGSPLLIDKPRLTRKKERKKFNPLGPWKYIGDDYARLLNSYFCCVTCSGIFHTLHGKYLEIMAAGSLLLADDCADVRKAGLVPAIK